MAAADDKPTAHEGLPGPDHHWHHAHAVRHRSTNMADRSAYTCEHHMEPSPVLHWQNAHAAPMQGCQRLIADVSIGSKAHQITSRQYWPPFHQNGSSSKELKSVICLADLLPGSVIRADSYISRDHISLAADIIDCATYMLSCAGPSCFQCSRASGFSMSRRTVPTLRGLLMLKWITEHQSPLPLQVDHPNAGPVQT